MRRDCFSETSCYLLTSWRYNPEDCTLKHGLLQLQQREGGRDGRSRPQVAVLFYSSGCISVMKERVTSPDSKQTDVFPRRAL
jgi:hypothetical protein